MKVSKLSRTIYWCISFSTFTHLKQIFLLGVSSIVTLFSLLFSKDFQELQQSFKTAYESYFEFSY